MKTCKPSPVCWISAQSSPLCPSCVCLALTGCLPHPSHSVKHTVLSDTEVKEHEARSCHQGTQNWLSFPPSFPLGFLLWVLRTHIEDCDSQNPKTAPWHPPPVLCPLYNPPLLKVCGTSEDYRIPLLWLGFKEVTTSSSKKDHPGFIRYGL
jgi:hypothetical protein